MRVRRRAWEILEVAEPGDRTSRVFDIAIRALIALNVLAVILETIAAVDRAVGPWLLGFEVFSVAVFTVEYGLRVWSCTAEDRWREATLGRLRFAATPLMVIDLLAVFPAYLVFLDLDLRILRGVRLFRLFRILRFTRYARGLNAIGRAFSSRKAELVVALGMVAMLLLVAASVMYYAEHDVQPDVFTSIPAAMWWGIVTLTTLGYGDVVPVTRLGRMMAGLFALSGVMLIALPTAILSRAFIDYLGEPGEPPGTTTGTEAPAEGLVAGLAGPDAPREGAAGTRACPHCGGPLES